MTSKELGELLLKVEAEIPVLVEYSDKENKRRLEDIKSVVLNLVHDVVVINIED